MYSWLATSTRLPRQGPNAALRVRESSEEPHAATATSMAATDREVVSLNLISAIKLAEEST